MLRSVSSFAVICVLASTALGHEGHGHAEHQQGVTHYIVNPSHAVPIMLLAAAIVGIGILIRRSNGSRRS